MPLLRIARYRGGVLLLYRDVGVLLDPSTHVGTGDGTDYYVFISHAHIDHSRGLSIASFRRYATYQTIALCRSRGQNIDGVYGVRYGDIFSLPYGVSVEVLNAGHILGSAIFRVETPEAVILYTGDFNTVRSFTVEPAETARCDIAIIESTYGSPNFILPPRGRVYLDLVSWMVRCLNDGYTPVIQTDVLGNSQELNTVINKLTNVKVYVHPRVARYNRVYEEYGCQLKYSVSGIDFLDGVYIVPKDIFLDNPRFKVGFASGWALRFSNDRYPIPFSDHADFKSIIGYIEEIKPKKVYTFHGGIYDRVLAKEIMSRVNIDASPLPDYDR
ncbi:MAG: MBL fold metallo-hydrolase [Nitrososphaerota archaeon]|nr:MBL fold metallo-hydrolase [Candidatus Bathyarchaeota archaeon]MDW8062286.1 MBL fold metallo-hydrolase [Nitrososphaerota archaeon]